MFIVFSSIQKNVLFSALFPVVFIKYLRVQSKHEILRNEWANEWTKYAWTEPTETIPVLTIITQKCFEHLSAALVRQFNTTEYGFWNSTMCYFLLLFPFSACVYVHLLFVCARACVFCLCCVDIVIYLFGVVVCVRFFYIHFKSSFVFVFLHCASNKMTHNWMLLYCCLFENMLHTIISTYWAYGILVSRLIESRGRRERESERKRIEIFWTLTTVLCFICG